MSGATSNTEDPWTSLVATWRAQGLTATAIASALREAQLEDLGPEEITQLDHLVALGTPVRDVDLVHALFPRRAKAVNTSNVDNPLQHERPFRDLVRSVAPELRIPEIEQDWSEIDGVEQHKVRFLHDKVSWSFRVEVDEGMDIDSVLVNFDAFMEHLGRSARAYQLDIDYYGEGAVLLAVPDADAFESLAHNLSIPVRAKPLSSRRSLTIESADSAFAPEPPLFLDKHLSLTYDSVLRYSHISGMSIGSSLTIAVPAEMPNLLTVGGLTIHIDQGRVLLPRLQEVGSKLLVFGRSGLQVLAPKLGRIAEGLLFQGATADFPVLQEVGGLCLTHGARLNAPELKSVHGQLLGLATSLPALRNIGKRRVPITRPGGENSRFVVTSMFRTEPPEAHAELLPQLAMVAGYPIARPPVAARNCQRAAKAVLACDFSVSQEYTWDEYNALKGWAACLPDGAQLEAEIGWHEAAVVLFGTDMLHVWNLPSDAQRLWWMQHLTTVLPWRGWLSRIFGRS